MIFESLVALMIVMNEDESIKKENNLDKW